MTTPTTSTLLAALIAASTATNGVITVGDTQPFDQVRLYQNPANDTVLTNQSSDGAIDTSTTALVVTGSTAPTGLVFEPNLAVLRNVTSDIKLLVDTSVELTLTVDIAGILTEMTVEAGNTAVLTLGLIAGIPMIVGSHGFFPVATDGNGAVGGLLLIPTGADESVDGEYQRFVYDGEHAYEVAPETLYPIWHAELPAQHRQSEYQIALKMPELSGDQAVNLFITDADISLAGLLERDFNYLALELRANDGSTGLLLNIADDQANSTSNGFLQPAAGSVITLTLTTSSLDYVYDGGTGSIDIPAGFFANPPNIWAYSGAMDAADVMPLSIKVAGA